MIPYLSMNPATLTDIEMVGRQWGYDWGAIRPELSIADMQYLNAACKLGFICSNLVYADNVEKAFVNQIGRYKEILKDGKLGLKHKQWMEELSNDPLSMHYICYDSTDQYGCIIELNVLREGFNYYRKFGVPYKAALRKVRTGIYSIDLQSGIGFSSKQLEVLQRYHKLGFNGFWVANLKLSAGLLQKLYDLAVELRESGYELAEVEEICSMLAHPQFNGYSFDKLKSLSVLSSREQFSRYFELYSEWSEKLIVSHAAFDKIRTLHDYSKCLLQEAADYVNSGLAFVLLECNQSCYDEVLFSLPYFSNADDFIGLMMQIDKDADNVEAALHYAVLLQQKLDGVGCCSELVPSGCMFTEDMFRILYRCIAVVGFETFKRYKDKLEIRVCSQDSGAVQERILFWLKLLTEWHKRYADANELFDLNFSDSYMAVISELLDNGVDARKLLIQDEKYLLSVKDDLIECPEIADSLSECSGDVSWVRFLKVLKENNVKYASYQVYQDFRSSFDSIRFLVEFKKFPPDMIFNFPSDEWFWIVLKYISQFSRNFVFAIKKDGFSELSDTWGCYGVIPSDQGLNGLLGAICLIYEEAEDLLLDVEKIAAWFSKLGLLNVVAVSRALKKRAEGIKRAESFANNLVLDIRNEEFRIKIQNIIMGVARGFYADSAVYFYRDWLMLPSSLREAVLDTVVLSLGGCDCGDSHIEAVRMKYQTCSGLFEGEELGIKFNMEISW